MSLELKEQFLSGSGSVKVRFFLTRSLVHPHLEVLIVRYEGVYPDGSAGNSDARYMHAMARAAVAAFEPEGVIHDLSNLKYEWGDRLVMVFDVGPDRELSPVAIIVGAGCEEAVRTLCVGINSDLPLESIGWAFRNLDAAFQYIEGKLEQIDDLT